MDIVYLEELKNDPDVKQFFPDDPRDRVKTMEKCGMRYDKNDIAKGIGCKFHKIKIHENIFLSVDGAILK